MPVMLDDFKFNVAIVPEIIVLHKAALTECFFINTTSLFQTKIYPVLRIEHDAPLYRERELEHMLKYIIN